VDIVCSHPTPRASSPPSSPPFRQLRSTPEPAVTRVAAEFPSRKGTSVTAAGHLKSDDSGPPRCAVETPVSFCGHALRAAGAGRPGAPWHHGMVLLDGAAALSVPTPDGYPDNEKALFGSLLWRWPFRILALPAQNG